MNKISKNSTYWITERNQKFMIISSGIAINVQFRKICAWMWCNNIHYLWIATINYVMTKCEVSTELNICACIVVYSWEGKPCAVHHMPLHAYDCLNFIFNRIFRLFFSSLSFEWCLGAKMHLQRLSIQQVYTSNLEASTQALIILILGVAIIISNAVIIATIINFRGKCFSGWNK